MIIVLLCYRYKWKCVSLSVNIPNWVFSNFSVLRVQLYINMEPVKNVFLGAFKKQLFKEHLRMATTRIVW